jgi:hypothetical protein
VRLNPEVSVEEALEWLKQQAVITWGIEMTPQVAATLRPTAVAMAGISRLEIPDHIEPLLL